MCMFDSSKKAEQKKNKDLEEKKQIENYMKTSRKLYKKAYPSKG